MSDSQERVFQIIDLERRLYDVAMARSGHPEDSPKFAELDAIHRQLDEERMKLLLEATDMDLLALEDSDSNLGLDSPPSVGGISRPPRHT